MTRFLVIQEDTCQNCDGCGYVRCPDNSEEACTKCGGRGNIRNAIELKDAITILFGESLMEAHQ